MSKELIKKWELSKGRAACGEIDLTENATLVYWDEDFVQDLMAYVSKLKRQLELHNQGVYMLKSLLRREG